jgi:5S rRNA maturation endonuclease (ribonuclease M5)
VGWVKIPKRKERPATMDDLREYVSLLEELGGKRFRRSGQGYQGCALHRPDRNPSLGVFIGRGGSIVVKDFSWDRAWSYASYLRELGREDLAQAWRERFEEWDPTKEKSGHTREKRRARRALPLPASEVPYMEVQPSTDEWEAETRAKMEEAREALLNGEHPETLRYMERRGLTPELAYAAGLGAVKEGIAIPVYDEDLRPKNVKVRRWSEERGRFTHLFSGRGSGYYFSPDFAWRPMRRVIIVEGEKNAAAVYLALGLPTIGVPGAGTGLSRKLVERLKEFTAEVVVLTDQDDAGRGLMERILSQLVEGGYDMRRVYVPMEDRYHRDPMDILKDNGLDYLRKNLSERIFNRASRLKKGSSSAGAGVAKAAASRQEGLNTKRSLLMATGRAIVRRHAKYVEPEKVEAVANLEDFITGEAMKEGVRPDQARKAARMWMVERKITPNTALFIAYEANGVNTGSKELKDKFAYARKAHPFTTKYRRKDERGRVSFDIQKLLEDAVREVVEMAEEVAGFFRRIAERVGKEREEFARWVAGLPHLLKRILRQPSGVSPPVAAAA